MDNNKATELSAALFIFIKRNCMKISKETLMALSDEEKVQTIYELQELLQAKIPNDYQDSDEISKEEIIMLEAEYAEYKKNPSSAILGDFAMQMIRSAKDGLVIAFQKSNQGCFKCCEMV